MTDRLILFSGNANRALSQEIADYLGVPLGDAEVTRFADDEILVQVCENVRGADVFVIQPTCRPVNENLMELLVIIDALKRASAWRITAVMPYYGYGRQDRKVQPRVPITAKLVADLLTAAGVHRVLTMDLHAGQIQGFFTTPVDHLYAAPVLLRYFEERRLGDAVVVSPDAGGVERARAFAKRLGSPLAFIDKRRTRPNEAKIMHIVGDVEGRDVIIVDDMIDTGGTLTQAVTALLEKGAKRIFASCTHPVLSGPAVERIDGSALEEVVVTNTIPLPDGRMSKKLTVLSVAPLLGEAISRIHKEESVSCLFV
ncbi:phosphoribosylpyrophosphate synthetase [Candidatus Methylomirabilis limnetica]|uniref:Ribose-phosphate pyrophosphokinase n=1 Tax=Candidatus Methylomirabilis limnetica TaxID=2033718 RepID=A0A2T4TXB1_9BACT|nr:ribose-phosphate pyrophosphokinase [Candidatus Methylomirabilis limnetica]PTL35740.1 phosphoribosylpyrophosphate synthetase [Candidatus Methylomirabilis limnetica]